ncbi:MAG: response regulator [Gammaproteobacteria bacterium]|nr:response regulator [Gammaproteobacteria bacterium]
MIGNVVGCYIFATIRSEQQQIKLNNQKLSQALAHSPVSFVITDTRGVIEYVNPEFENISGYSFQELKGNTPALLQSGKTPPSTYKQMWESIKSGNKWEGEFINLRKNKTLFVEKATIAPLFNASGEIINFIGIKSDISEIKYAEADIKLSKLEAENASAAKTEFISNMSHELRTPLNAILGFSEALLDENLNQQTGKEQLIFAQHIHQSSLHLLDLVNDIMELSQIENQNINLQIEPFCLEHLLDETVTTFSHEYKNKDLILTTIDHDIPEKLKGDKRRIRQVISNLLDNGIRYSGGQMVTMKVTAPQKSKTIIKLRIEINDRGPGIPADKQKIIFNKFATLNTVSHTERRSGLGLTICKELTSKMDGEIGLFSKPGIGTTFWIELPLGVCDKLEVAESERACSTRNTSSLNIFNNKHILVTEDDKVNQLLIKHILTKLGCRVTICENGLEALKCLSKEVCDLVLMDCQMPLMDGYETTKRFRNSIEFDHSIPVIALTANSIRGDREKCLAAGMNDYLSKPINRELLTETMARWLMKRKGSS